MLQDLHKTIERLDAEIRERPTYAAYFYRAGLLLAVGRLDDALRDCDEAQRRQPNASRAFFMRSEILRRQGHEAEAQAAMTKARSLPKENDSFEAELRSLLARVEGGTPPSQRPQRRLPGRVIARPKQPPHSSGPS